MEILNELIQWAAIIVYWFYFDYIRETANKNFKFISEVLNNKQDGKNTKET